MIQLQLRTTLLFGSVGLWIILVIGICGFVTSQISVLDNDGYLPKEGFLFPVVALMIPFVLMIPYFLVVGGYLGYRQATWQGRRWANLQVYSQLLVANILASLVVFVPLILFLEVELASCLEFVLGYFIGSVLSAGVILPKNNY